MKKVVQGKTLYHQVADYIKEKIAQGVYKKGDLIPSETQLINTLGVGRVTVRGGLKILSEEGIIRTVKGKGSFVQVDFKEIRNDKQQQEYRKHFLDSTQLRIFLEPAIAQEIALHGTQAAKEEIGRVLYEEKSQPEKFHRAIVNALENELAEELFEHLSELESAPKETVIKSPSVQDSFYKIAFEQHEQIYDAIKAGDAEAAYFHMKKHLEYVETVHEDFFRFY